MLSKIELSIPSSTTTEPAAPPNMQFDAEGNVINLPKPSVNLSPPSVNQESKSSILNNVVNQEPKSARLNNVVNQNLELNLPSNTTNKALKDAEVNKVINTPQGRNFKKIPIPPVRNLEASFQRMIMSSTRVV